MSDYQSLTHLLEKAKREDRIGEVLHYVGFEKEIRGHIEKYQDKLSGRGTVLDPSQNDQAFQQAFPVPKAKAKSVAQKGQALLSTMAMGSAGTSTAMGSELTATVGNVPLMQRFLDEQSKVSMAGALMAATTPSVAAGAPTFGTMDGSLMMAQAPITAAVNDVACQGLPSGSEDAQLRWKAKWQPGGTARGILRDNPLHDGRALRMKHSRLRLSLFCLISERFGI